MKVAIIGAGYMAGLFAERVHGIFNVGNGGSTLEERIFGIRNVFCRSDKTSEIKYCPKKKDCTQYVLDISKTEKVLDYKPQYTWKDYFNNLKRHITV